MFRGSAWSRTLSPWSVSDRGKVPPPEAAVGAGVRSRKQTGDSACAPSGDGLPSLPRRRGNPETHQIGRETDREGSPEIRVRPSRRSSDPQSGLGLKADRTGLFIGEHPSAAAPWLG